MRWYTEEDTDQRDGRPARLLVFPHPCGDFPQSYDARRQSAPYVEGEPPQSVLKQPGARERPVRFGLGGSQRSFGTLASPTAGTGPGWLRTHHDCRGEKDFGSLTTQMVRVML